MVNKKILYIIFSLFFIAGIDQVVFANFTSYEDDMMMYEIGDKWKKIKDKKTGLKIRSSNIKSRYPLYASGIEGLFSHLDTLEYEGVIQPRLDMSKENLGGKLQEVDSTIKNLKDMSRSFASGAALMPEEIKDFFGEVIELMIEVVDLAREEMVMQLDGIKVEKADGQNLEEKILDNKRIKMLLWTDGELEKLADVSLVLEKIKEEIDNDYHDSSFKVFFQTSISAVESHMSFIKKSHKELYDVDELSGLIAEIESSRSTHLQTAEWLEQFREQSPEIIEMLEKTRKLFFKATDVFEKVVKRTMDEHKQMNEC